MAASSKLMITEAERRFPCRIKVGVPTGGLDTLLTEMHTWLDENCGADGWAMTPAGLRGAVKIADNRFFLPETVPQLAAIARDLTETSRDGVFTAAMFNERSGVGRNLTIQILEYLDKIGATRRIGDVRVAVPGAGFG